MSATPIEISVGGSRWASSWAQDLMTWEDFTESLSARMYNNASAETHAEYMALSKAEQDTLRDMRIVQEMYARGFEFMPIDIYRAKARNFQIIDGKLMPSLSSIDGLGEKAADAIVFAAEDGKFLSKEDFINRTKVTKTVCDLMAELGILTGLPESNQLSLFDMVM